MVMIGSGDDEKCARFLLRIGPSLAECSVATDVRSVCSAVPMFLCGFHPIVASPPEFREETPSEKRQKRKIKEKRQPHRNSQFRSMYHTLLRSRL